jgi:putative Holliday junction resolvase
VKPATPESPPSAGKLLGFDYGARKIGVAVGQTLTGTATPIVTLHSVKRQPDWEGITKLLSSWRPEALVVGIPYNMDDSANEMTAAALRFGRQLAGRYHLPVHLIDERLTTIEARRIIDQAISTGSHARRLEKIDQLAAQLILESWLATEHHARNL